MVLTVEEEDFSSHKQVLSFLRGLLLFEKLDPEETKRFAIASHSKFHQKGHILYLENEKAECFYVIRSGWIKLFHTTQEGEEVILAMLTAKNIIGKDAIFHQGNFTSTAQVVEDVQVLGIPLVLLNEQLHKNSQLALNMLNSLTQYQRLHERQLEQYLVYSAPQRIGCFLLGLCPVLEQIDGVELTLPYDKTLIASVLGMKGATFSRALNILRQETGLQIIGTQVKIESMERLLKFVDGCYSSYALIKD
jgi:CRP-like cAMP-binding protein